MVRIVTDSVSDIPSKYINEYDIKVMPMNVIIGDKTYKDRVDITPESVFEKIKDNKEFPKTSQVTPYEFESVFENMTKDGDSVLAILMSSQMSGTYNSACIAKNNLEDRCIEVVDSKGITLGYGLIVIEAAKMAKEGKSIDEIKERIYHMINTMEYLIVFDTLEYVYKGGRIGKTEYVLANFLNLKMIMTLKDGKLEGKDKVRGRKKVIKWIVDYIKQNNFDLKDKVIGINHVNDNDYMNELKDVIMCEFNPKDIILSDVGSTVAAYSGLSALAIYFEREN